MASLISFPRREMQAISLIGFAHLLSHLYLLPLAPLLLAMERDLGITKAEYGIALAAYAITTGILQTPMGLLVERIGGRKVLIFGLFLTSICFVLIGLYATNFWTLTMLMGVAGIGNSVFHPADYSLISSSVREERLGRAFSIHTFVGHMGFLAGPIITASLEPLVGWRTAVLAIGITGVAMSVVLVVFQHLISDGTEVKKQAPVGDRLRELVTSRPILLFFVFYICASGANIGVTQFSVVAFRDMYGLDTVVSVFALTAYQIGTMALVLPGGLLADRTRRYDTVLAIGFGFAAVVVLLVGTGILPFWLVVVVLCVGGALRGGVNASRDVAVRNVAAHIPVGTVFGFVSTGFLVGQAIGGPLYGWLYDTYSPNVVFYCSAAFYVIGISTILFNTGARKQAAAAE